MSALREKTIEMMRQLPEEQISYVFNVLHNLEPVMTQDQKDSEAALERLMRYRGTPLHGVPNAETVAALVEAERIAHDPNVRRYSDVEEALLELKK